MSEEGRWCSELRKSKQWNTQHVQEERPCLFSHLGAIRRFISYSLWQVWAAGWTVHVGGDERLSIHRRVSSEGEWSCVEQLCVKSSPGPTPVCLESTEPPCPVLSHHSLSWRESSACWQDLGQIVPDWRQAELTRILKEINASHCTTIRKFLIQSQEMKPADWNVGMLGDRSRNVSLPWQGFCPWGSGNWYGLILLFT